MIQEVQFQGLSHSPSDHDAQDGELGTCLNLICEDGALKPIPEPQITDSSITLPEGASIELTHKVTHNGEIHCHYIIKLADGTWCWAEKGGDGTFTAIDLDGFSVNAVTAVGNILCFVGDDNTVYAYWKGEQYIYFDLSSFNFNATINNLISKECKVTALLGDDWETSFEKNYRNENVDNVSLKGTSIIFNALDAQINKELDALGDEYFKYTTFGVLAVHLYDGASYINISNPFILAPELTFNKFIWYQESKAVGTNTTLHTHTINVQMDIIPGIEDLILGVDVYLSQPESFIDTNKRTYGISRYQCFLWDSEMASGVNCDVFNMLSEEDVYQAFENKSFYLSARIDREKFGTDVQLKRIQETAESISLADFKRNTYGGKCAITYNNRLHIGNTKHYLFNAFDTNIYNSRKVSDIQISLNEYVDLEKSNVYSTDYICDAVFQVSITENSIKRDVYYGGKLQYPISPILVYPNTLAKVITIYFYLPKYDKYYSKKMTLRASDNFGISYYINISKNRKTDAAKDRQTANTLDNTAFGNRGDEATEEETSAMDDYMFRYHDDYGLPSFMQVCRHKLLRKEYSGGTFGNQDTTTQYSYYWDTTSIDTGDFTEITKAEFDNAKSNISNQKYIMQYPSSVNVSEAENPLVFPASNSVQVGSSTVTTLAANTQPISEGQFGEAPLYAFTDEGVWVLMTSSTGIYDSRQPTNRDICSNPKGILQTDNAVLYPTERGIMMLQGRSSTCITDQLDGYPFDFTQLYKNDYAKKVLAIENISESEVKYVRFRKYLESADMIYDYYDSRIIVFNPSYEYAYVYSLKSQQWGTMKNTFSKRVNIYPESYAINTSGKIVDVYTMEPTDDVSYLLCSRPLSLGSPEIHKTIFSAIARGYFRNERGKCGMVLYGSNDLFNWFPIKTSVNKYLRGSAGSPYKYFRIALVGKLSVDESISGMSADLTQRWQNKLR